MRLNHTITRRSPGPTPPGTHQDDRMPTTNRINPKKLLNSKWTAVNPLRKEKHFVITGLEFDDTGAVVHCEIEAVISKRAEAIDWRTLKDPANWRFGWR